MAIRQILITAIPFILLFIGCFFVYDYNKWLCLFFAPIIASYMSRLFMFMHDCGHRTFFKNNKANEYLGNIIGFFLLVPFGMWKYIHIIHHASAGNLDKRDKNPDLWTMTVKEYIESKWYEKLFYKIYRSHFMWLFIIPNFIFFILFRIPHKKLNKIAIKLIFTSSGQCPGFQVTRRANCLRDCYEMDAIDLRGPVHLGAATVTSAGRSTRSAIK